MYYRKRIQSLLYKVKSKEKKSNDRKVRVFFQKCSKKLYYRKESSSKQKVINIITENGVYYETWKQFCISENREFITKTWKQFCITKNREFITKKWKRSTPTATIITTTPTTTTQRVSYRKFGLQIHDQHIEFYNLY